MSTAIALTALVSCSHSFHQIASSVEDRLVRELTFELPCRVRRVTCCSITYFIIFSYYCIWKKTKGCPGLDGQRQLTVCLSTVVTVTENPLPSSVGGGVASASWFGNFQVNLSSQVLVPNIYSFSTRWLICQLCLMNVFLEMFIAFHALQPSYLITDKISAATKKKKKK